MTALADLLTRAERQRLEERLAELCGTDRMMREAGGLAGAAEPPPVHKMAASQLRHRETAVPSTSQE